MLFQPSCKLASAQALTGAERNFWGPNCTMSLSIQVSASSTRTEHSCPSVASSIRRSLPGARLNWRRMYFNVPLCAYKTSSGMKNLFRANTIDSGTNFYGTRIPKRLQYAPIEAKPRIDGGKARAYMRLDPGGGGGGGRGPNDGIGRVVFNLALAGGLTYLTVTGKLGWLFDAFISLWLLILLVPIVGIVAFLWFADREIVSGICPNCGNPFQVLEFSVKDEQQFCPYCSQPFKLEDKQFVREGPRFSTNKSKGFRRPFGGFGQQQTSHGPSTPADPPGVIVDVEAEVLDKD